MSRTDSYSFCGLCSYFGRLGLKKECDNFSMRQTSLVKCGEKTILEFKKLYENGYAIFQYSRSFNYWTPGNNISGVDEIYSTTIPFDLAYENRDKLTFYYFIEKY
jgi:hypothetical protein